MREHIFFSNYCENTVREAIESRPLTPVLQYAIADYDLLTSFRS
jgi:hypothetical protein